MMSLIKWNSNELFPKFDSVWDNFFNRDIFSKAIDLGTTVPAMNSKETDESYLLEVAIPGLSKEDIHLDLENDILTISSEKEIENEEKDGEKVTMREFSYTSFKRSFHLPENVKKDEILAEYTDGLLKLTIPKAKPDQIENKKQIAIK